EPGGEAGDAVPVDDAVGDESHGARGDVGAEVPRGCAGDGLGQAAAAGAEAGLVGGRGGEEEDDVVRPGRARRAGWAAVDPRRRHAGDELTVETGIAGADRPVPLREPRIVRGAHGDAARPRHLHITSEAGSSIARWRVSDTGAGGP